jgi:hypothetical protein
MPSKTRTEIHLAQAPVRSPTYQLVMIDSHQKGFVKPHKARSASMSIRFGVSFHCHRAG